ncbi:MAG: cytochrome c1 [Gammaproteobacteria bacterium]|nr:cytochrome c1 [Gammaproteobacteria bacterium]
MLIAAFLVPASVPAAGGSDIQLDHYEYSIKDKTSLQNGARIFVNYCLSCHSAHFMRYNRMAEDLGIPEQVVRENMIFDDRKIADPMTVALKKEDGEAWFGIAPPDLTLIGKLRDPDWLYTFLRSFYKDDSTVSGWNNAVFPNVAMPHVMWAKQGIQKPVYTTSVDDAGHETREITDFELVREGTLTQEEFDHAMEDLTNFLYYMAEPNRGDRIRWGVWTMFFLLVFAVLAWLLKREYWRDVH